MTAEDERCAEAPHQAVAEGNAAALRLILEAGADPGLRTRIDDDETPRELAEAAGQAELAAMLAAYGDAWVACGGPPPA